MSKVPKVIENPEIPGFESLPIPPPPPPPIISKQSNSSDKKKEKSHPSNLDNKKTNEKSPEKKINSGSSFNHESNTISGQTVANPFFAQTEKKIVPNDQPWWIPTDADTAEIVPHNMPDNITIQTELKKKIMASNKAKGKFNKRKVECIDPAKDAEKVASAQKELSSLMKPLKCDLCNAVMNSTLQAKLHYDGKPHQKKVSMFLNQSVKKLKPEDGLVSSTTSNDWNTYCDVCKTWFTSLVDASQHYAGKKHIRATTGISKQKSSSVATAPPSDPTGRFGIGLAFAASNSTGVPSEVAEPPIESITPTAVSPGNNRPTLHWPFPTYRCELCGVSANRQEQLETHKRGAKHQKMLKMCEEVKEYTAQAAPSSIDYSIYRTPSGQYYCAPCNRSFLSENSFAHHIESKKHKNQVNPKQQQPQTPPAVTKKFYVEKNT